MHKFIMRHANRISVAHNDLKCISVFMIIVNIASYKARDMVW